MILRKTITGFGNPPPATSPSTDEQAPVRDRDDRGLLIFLASAAANCRGIAVSFSDRGRLVAVPASGQLAGQGNVDLSGIRIIEGDTYSIIAASELALVASGTATLETTLLECPMVISYKVSALTYILGRMLVTGVDFIGMPNILAGRKIVPELIQGEMNARNLVRAAEPLLNPTMRDETVGALRALREKLGTPGAARRVALMALEMVGT